MLGQSMLIIRGTWAELGPVWPLDGRTDGLVEGWMEGQSRKSEPAGGGMIVLVVFGLLLLGPDRGRYQPLEQED